LNLTITACVVVTDIANSFDFVIRFILGTGSCDAIRHTTYVDSRLWLPDEAKIETEQEEDEMDDGAATADLRCFDKTSPQQRH
jgi:hypothetical protein